MVGLGERYGRGVAANVNTQHAVAALTVVHALDERLGSGSGGKWKCYISSRNGGMQHCIGRRIRSVVVLGP
jgi:hypothetical protein